MLNAARPTTMTTTEPTDRATELAGTCGICLATHMMMRTRGDTLVLAHHGYTRPGGGYQTMSCFSARRDAWEISSEPAKQYIVILRQRLAQASQYLSELKTGKVTSLPYSREKFPRVTDQHWNGQKYVKSFVHEEIVLHPGDQKEPTPAGFRNWESNWVSLSWDELLGKIVGKVTKTVSELTSDIATLEARVAKWKLGVLIDATVVPRFTRAPGAPLFQVVKSEGGFRNQRITRFEIWTGFKWEQLRAEDWYKLQQSKDAEMWDKDRTKLLLPSGAPVPERVRNLTMTQEKLLRQLAKAEGGSLRHGLDGKGGELKCSWKSVLAMVGLGLVTATDGNVTITDVGRVSVG